MTKDQREIQRKLRILRYAEEIGFSFDSADTESRFNLQLNLQEVSGNTFSSIQLDFEHRF